MRSLEMKSLRSRAILSFFIALAPILLYSIALKLKIGQSPYQLDPVNFSGIDVAKWQSIGVSFFGRSVTIVSFGLAASVLIWQKSYLKLRYFFGGLIIAFTIVANPLWAGQVADHITSSATYWRLFWVMLPELLIATFAYYLISHLAAGKLSTIGKLIVSIVMVAVVALLFGTFLFTKGAGFSKARNIYKVPESAIAASNLPDGSLILADQLTAAYVRSVNPRIRVAYSRDGYMSFVLQNEELEFEALNGLFQAVNSTGPIPPYFTEKLLDRKIDYIVYTATNSTLVNFTAQDSHFKTVSKDRRFYIKRICSIDCSH